MWLSMVPLLVWVAWTTFRDKVSDMVWCLAEATFDQARKHVSDASSITPMRDVRKGLAAVRYVAVSKQLEVKSGLLGIANSLQQFGTGAKGLLSTTNHISTISQPVAAPPIMPRYERFFAKIHT